ncbi:MAG TPA: hypothetical protein VG406_14300 [Isosphaeraceae bacterium]|jgi:hypothetical protein|nr:hypothetical protein [Isosphaeraceae bacterium]
MRRIGFMMVSGGTPDELVWATALGARIAARRHRARGLEADAVRRLVVDEYREVLEAGYDGPTLETLLGTVREAVDDVLS